MILDQKTLSSFGYLPETISKKSKKPVYVKCDYCGNIVTKTMQSVTLGRQYIIKDACNNCKFKKRADVTEVKHGVKNCSQIERVKQKISKSNAKRLRSQKHKDQTKQTNLRKYGVEHAMQNPDILEKQQQTLFEKYGATNPSLVPEIKSRATKAMIETRIRTGTYQSYEGKTRPEIAREQGFSRSHFGKLVNKYGFEKAVTMTPHESALEVFVENWLKEFDIEHEKQVRIQDKIADFKIDNLILELDGLYWHSDANKQNKNYHAEKRQIYLDNGLKPLFFRENEVYNKFEIVKSIILHHLNKATKRIYARKCKVAETDSGFFEQNHLMGKGMGQIFALSYNNETVCAMQIRRLRDKNYEISRFCSALYTRVIGGFSKLLKYVENNIDMDSLITYIDLRYGAGRYLSNLGFIEDKTYLSFKWTDGSEIFHRLKFRGNSGYQYGLYKLWDCGQTKWGRCYLGV